jgi:hypothetical protein
VSAEPTAVRFLVEIDAYDPAIAAVRTLYLTHESAFITRPGDTPAHQVFDVCLAQPLAMQRRLQGLATPFVKPSLGDIVVNNADGTYDAWADYAWDGRDCRVRMGPAVQGAYPTDYPVLVTAKIDRVDVLGREVRIRLRDEVAAVLQQPLQDALYAGDNVPPDGLEGGEELKGQRKPLVLGRARNIPLTCVNPQKLIYQASDNELSSLVAYDAGVPLVGTAFGTAITIGNLRGYNTGPANRGGIAFSSSLARYVAAGRGNAGAGEAIYTCDAAALSTWTARSSVFDDTGGTRRVRSVRWFDGLGFVAVGVDNASTGSCATSPTGTTWTTRTLAGLAAAGVSDAYASAYGAGVLVVVGVSGLIDYSTDGGATFNAAVSPLVNGIQDVTFYDGVFVAVGSGGEIATSLDGITWTAQTSGTVTNLSCVIYVGGRWVALGNSGVVVTSDDFTLWTVRSDGLGVGKDSAAVFAELLVGVGGTSTPSISDDYGATWAALTAPGFNVRDLISDGSRFIGFGEVSGSQGARVAILSGYSSYASDADLEDDTLAPPKGTYAVRASAAGTYVRLGATPAGQLAADAVQGAAAADRTAAALIEDVLARAGYVGGEWSAADLTALDAADSSEQGLFLPTGGEESVADVIGILARSLGAWWGVDADGVLRFAQLTAPSGSAAFAIVDDDLRKPLERLASSDPLRGLPTHRTTLRYQRNWTVQRDGLAGVVTPERRAVLAREWREAVSEDAAVLAVHPLAAVAIDDTCYDAIAAAEAEADRRQALFGTQRDAFIAVLPIADFGRVAFGAVGTLTHPRYGLSAGTLVRVLGIELDAAAREVTLTLWR